MNLHEYQAKQLLKADGIAPLAGEVIFSVEEVEDALQRLGEQSDSPVVAVKAQIHAGGRGKGRFLEHPDLGGVVVVTDGIEGGRAALSAKVTEIISQMLGSTLVTVQTGSAGSPVNRVYLESGLNIATELYLSVLLDRSRSRLALVASAAGGMDIEEVAQETPEAIYRIEIDPCIGLAAYQTYTLSHQLQLSDTASKHFGELLGPLVEFVQRYDATQLEINPLVVTDTDQVIPLDTKLIIDDNALFRQPELVEMADQSAEDPIEVDAARVGLSYIKLDGNIGCMVNGAGLAMSTMDIIKHVGGEPANFLDVGGGASAEQVAVAFELITRDPNVRGIFVNIFGGIMRCDTIASGICEAIKKVGLSVPLVVRLEGTNVELGKEILDKSGLNVVTASDMKEGAAKIVELSR